MKAIEMYGYGGVDQLRYENVASPKPARGEVVIKVGATSVNPIDWKIRRGYMKDVAPLDFPVIPGRDVAGEIVETGPDVSKWKAGQRVMGVVNGSYAEYVAARGDNLAEVPDGLDIEKAGVLPLVATTGAELIEQIQPKQGDTVLVTGALGGVGRTAVYAAKQRGATVIAGVQTRQMKQAESLGADRVIALDNPQEIQALPQLDAIADTVGGDVIKKLIPKLKSGGILGSVVGQPETTRTDIRVAAFRSHPDPNLLRRLAEAVRDRKLDIPIARKFKLSEAAEAQKLSEGGGVDGKIILVP